MVWSIECETEIKKLICCFADLHPQKYDVKDNDCYIRIKVKGNCVFDFETGKYILKLNPDEDIQ